MSVAKVLELTARSSESFADAVQQAVTKAGESVHGIREAWIQTRKSVSRTGWSLSIRST